MPHGYLDIAATPSVLATQAAMGSEELWQTAKGGRPQDRFGPRETAFIAQRDSFFLATVSETGWPYVQHRGGPAGFLKVLDDATLAFADFRGNRQYITAGNLAGDGRAALILVDHARRLRLKLYAHTETVALDADPALSERVIDADYGKGRPERLVVLHLAAFDWNCPQHLTPRFTEAEIAEAVAPLRARLEELEAENAEMRSRLGDLSR